MLRKAAVLAWSMALFTASHASAQETPYEAVVIADSAAVYSGPGKAYYVTSKLKRGQQLRVLRHSLGGWYAIEPPADSFSWVERRSLRSEKGDAGIVTDDDVQVLVGSQETNRHDVEVGIRLHRGDRVTILGQETFSDRENETQFYKIRSIRGEERWISGQHVKAVQQGKSPSAGRTLTQTSLTTKDKNNPSADSRRTAPKAASDTTKTSSRDGPSAAQQPARRRKAARARANDSENVKKHASSEEPSREESYEDDESGIAPPRPVQIDPAAFLVAQGDRRLSDMTAQDIAQWDLHGVRALYEQAQRDAVHSSTRLAAQRSLSRLEHYDFLKQNHDPFQRPAAHAPAKDVVVQTKYREDPIPTRADPSTRYDGAGRLVPTAMQGAGAPSYKLVDARGNVSYYVSPALGVDLRPYVEDTVAVIGSVKYRTDLRAYHITARQILPQEEKQGLAEATSPRKARYRSRSAYLPNEYPPAYRR